MSSTNRGAKRAPQDFYGTEAWLVDAVLPHLPMDGAIADAGAGEGQIASRLLAAGVPANRVTAYEIDLARANVCAAQCPGVRVVVADFLRTPLFAADAVVMNPPYDVKESPGTTAFAFVKRAHDLVGSRGTVAALLRLNWLEGAQSEEPERLAFLKAHAPDVLISPKRGKFGLNKHGKFAGDSCAYAWMVWGPGRKGRVSWLDLEPIALPIVDPRQASLFDRPPPPPPASGTVRKAKPVEDVKPKRKRAAGDT